MNNMEIRKFKHVDNGRLVYAIIGAKSSEEADKFLYKYLKISYMNYINNYRMYKGCINTLTNELYVSTPSLLKHEKPCYIIANKNLDIMKYAC